MHSPSLITPRLVIASICSLLLFSACAQDVANRYYSTRRYPARDPRSVELLFRAPERPFRVIADFQSRGESPEDFRRRAAKIGADAVIVTRIGGTYQDSDWVTDNTANSGGSTRGNRGHLVGSAIKYTQ
jgi:hypothetical protein